MKWIYIVILPLLCLTLASSCSEDPEEEETETTPACILDQVETFADDQSTCENASVKKYMYQAQEVYVFQQGICISDGGADVLLADCSSLCFLGGIAGVQDCNGDLFFDVAVELETIWEFN